MSLGDTSKVLSALSFGWFNSSLKFRFITNSKTDGAIVSNAQEVCIVFIKRTNGHAAWFKTKFFVVVGLA